MLCPATNPHISRRRYQSLQSALASEGKTSCGTFGHHSLVGAVPEAAEHSGITLDAGSTDCVAVVEGAVRSLGAAAVAAVAAACSGRSLDERGMLFNDALPVLAALWFTTWC